MHTSLTNSASEYAVGIDIGTTSLSLSVIDLQRKAPVTYRTVKNTYTVGTDDPDLFMQDPEAIYEAASLLLSDILTDFPSTRVIGVTGQMHGILYIDEGGKAVSPLYTWRDRRADRMHPSGVSYSDALCRLTGKRIKPCLIKEPTHRRIMVSNDRTRGNLADLLQALHWLRTITDNIP